MAPSSGKTEEDHIRGIILWRGLSVMYMKSSSINFLMLCFFAEKHYSNNNQYKYYYVVTFVNHSWGDSAQFKELAEKKVKR